MCSHEHIVKRQKQNLLGIVSYPQPEGLPPKGRKSCSFPECQEDPSPPKIVPVPKAKTPGNPSFCCQDISSCVCSLCAPSSPSSPGLLTVLCQNPPSPAERQGGLSTQVLWELGEGMTESHFALGRSYIFPCFGDPNLGSHPATWAAEQLCGHRQIPPPL